MLWRLKAYGWNEIQLPFARHIKRFLGLENGCPFQPLAFSLSPAPGSKFGVRCWMLDEPLPAFPPSLFFVQPSAFQRVSVSALPLTVLRPPASVPSPCIGGQNLSLEPLPPCLQQVTPVREESPSTSACRCLLSALSVITTLCPLILLNNPPFLETPSACLKTAQQISPTNGVQTILILGEGLF
jgi:hypothetical protein